MKKVFTFLMCLVLVTQVFGAMRTYERNGLYYAREDHEASGEYLAYVASPDDEDENQSYAGLTSVVIPDTVVFDGIVYTVVGIYDEAFLDCQNLASVTFSNSLRTIGESAFRGCTGLDSIVIPASVKEINYDAFAECSNLVFVSVPGTNKVRDEFTIYYKGVFRDCNNLKTIAITEGTTEIGNETFKELGLTSIVIPEGVKTIGQDAFRECHNLVSVSLPSTLETIGEYAFRMCALDSITIPASVKTINGHAFEHCYHLKSIVFQGAVESFGGEMFSACNSLQYTEESNIKYLGNNENPYLILVKASDDYQSFEINTQTKTIANEAFNVSGTIEDLTVPDSVKFIGYNSFERVKKIVYHGTATGSPWGARLINVVTDGDFLYADSNKTILVAYTGSDSLVNIPNGVVKIDQSAFYSNSDLKSVVIPNTVKNIGGWAFSDCFQLVEVTVPNSVDTIGSYAFNHIQSVFYKGTADGSPWGAQFVNPTIENGFIYTDSTKTVLAKYIGTDSVITILDGVTEIGAEAFRENRYIKSVVMDSTLVSIGDNAFYECPNLQSISLPDGLKTIGWYSFTNCGSLRTVTIPDGVETIHYAFNNGVQFLYYNGTADGYPWGARFANPIIYGDFVFADSAKTILKAYLGTDNEVVIPNGVVEIKEYAFKDNNFIKSVVITDSVKTINDGAFSYCDNLSTVSVPLSVETMGYDVFSGYWSVTVVCDFASKPDSWPDNWNGYGSTVVWKKAPFSVTIYSENGTVTGFVSDSSYYYGDTLKLTIKPAKGYKFSRWSDWNDENPRTIVVNSNIELSAEFEEASPVYVNIRSKNTFLGTVSGFDNNKSYLEGDTLTLTATPVGKFGFEKWSDGNTDNPRTIIINGETTLIAEFEEPFELADSCGWGSIGSFSELTKNDDGKTTQVDLSFSNSGYRWDAQFVTPSFKNLGNEGDAFELSFDVKYSGEFEYGQPTIVAGKTIPYNAEYDQANNTQIVDEDGYSLSWGRDFYAEKEWTRVSYNYYLGAEGADSVRLEFDLGSYAGTYSFKNIVLKVAGNTADKWFCSGDAFISATAAYGTVTGSGSYNNGDTVMLTAMPYSGYKFKQWSDGNTDNPRIVAVDGDATYTAELEPIYYSSADFPFNTWWTSDCQADSVQFDSSLAAKIFVSEDQANGNSWDAQFCNIFHELDGQTEGNYVKVSFDVYFDGEADTAVVKFLTGKLTWSLNPDIHEDYQYSSNNTEILDEYGSGIIWRTFEIEKGRWQTITVEGTIGEAGANYIGIELDLGGNANNVGDFYFRNMTMTVGGNVATKDYFDSNKVLVNLSANIANSGYLSGAGFYNIGDTVTLTATANKGYTFKQWSDGNTNATRTIIVESDTAFAAEFGVTERLYEYAEYGFGKWFTHGNNLYGLYTNQNNEAVAMVEEAGNPWDAQFCVIFHEAEGQTEGNSFQLEFDVMWEGSNTDTTAIHILTGKSNPDLDVFTNYQWNAYDDTTNVEKNTELIFDGGFWAGHNKEFRLPYGEWQHISWGGTIGEKGNDYIGLQINLLDDNEGLYLGTYRFKNVVVKMNNQIVARDFYNGNANLLVSASGENGTVTGGGYYSKGDEVRLTATPNQGYLFKQWSDGSTKNPRTVTVNGNMSFVAEFVVDDSNPLFLFGETNTWFVSGTTVDRAYEKDNIASLFVSEYCDQWLAQFCNILTGLDGQEAGNNFQLDFDVNWNGLDSDKATIYLLAGKVEGGIHEDYQWSDSIAELVNAEGTVDGIRYAGYDLADGEWTHVSWGGIITETGAEYVGIEINLGMKEADGDNRGTFNFKNMKVRINGEVVKQDFCTGELLVNATAGENGTVNGAGFYTKGDTATITAIADEYYYFKQWSDGNSDNPRTFVVNDDMSFTAEFATNAVNIPYYAESDSINAWYVNGSLVKKAITADNIASITVSENGNLWESQFCNILSGLDGQEAGSKFQLDFDVNWNSLSGADKAQIMMVTGKSGYGDRYSDDENTELVNDNGNFNGIQYATYQIANNSWTHISWGGTIGEKGADYIGVGIYFNKFDEEADKRGTFNFKNMKVRINGEVVKQDFCTGELFVNATAKNGTVTGAGYYTKGDTATLAVTPNDGCIFKQWSDGNTDNPRTFVVTDDASFVAEIEREEVNYTSADYPFNTWWASGSTADSVQMGASGYAAKINISEEQAEGDRWDVQFCNIFHQFDGQVEGNNVKLSFDVKFEGAADTATITFVTGKITWSLNPEIHEDYQWTDDNTEIVDEYGYMVRSFEYDIEKGKWQNITIEGKIGEKGAKYIGIELDLAGNAGNTNNVGDFYFKNMTLSVNGNIVTSDYEVIENTKKSVLVIANNELYGNVSGTGTYNFGDTVTATANAFDDCEFIGWSDGSTSNPYSFVVTKDVKLTANFQKKAVVVETFTVSVAADSTFGSVRGAGTYKLGDTATIVALENDGYEFTGWSDGNTNALRTIVVTADVKLTALFRKRFNPERTVDGLVFFLTDTTAHTAELIGLADSLTVLDAPAEIKIEGVAYQVTGIGNKAFAGCTQLDSINIPESIETIGIEAFANCTGTVSIVIPNTVDSIGYNAFLNVKNIVYEGNATGSPWGALTVNGTFDGDYIYDTESSLTVYTGTDTAVVIPDEVSTIGHNAFAGNETVTSVEIPESVTEIGDGAFNGCSNLESVELPKSVESIGNETFANCTSLESVEIPESVKEIGGSAFNGCSSLTAIQIPVSVTVIGQSAFANCSKLDAVEIPESVNELGNGAFTNCTSLVSVSIPVSVTVIGAETFSGCSSLNNIEIPSATTEIGNNAFDGCSSLTTISIPVSVTTIGNGAFAYCNSLVTVQIGTFINVKNEGVSTLADGSVSIGSRAFIGCDSLTAVYIPLSVASIGDSAFAGCKNLTIYCEAESMPEGWSESWNPEGCKVVWNYNGKPQVVEFNLIAIANNSRYGSVTGSATYTKGATATITATAAEGYKFVGWSDGNTDNPRTVVVTGDLAFTAVFEAVTAIDDEAAAAVNIFAYSNTIVVENADSNISVYDANGRLIATEQPAGQRTEILIANKGVYLVKVGNTTKRVMVF